jgi:dolichol-phosphate mannosyltransferase
MMVFGWVPLLVFIIFSVHSQPKLNWTGPVWLAVIPFVAREMSPAWSIASSRFVYFVRKLWLPTIFVMLVIYFLGMGYIYLGVPGIPPQSGLSVPVAWSEFGKKVKTIIEENEREIGTELIIAGIDKYWISSQTSFYVDRDKRTIDNVGGQHLFGYNGLMWQYWMPADSVYGDIVLVISFESDELDDPNILDRFLYVSEKKTEYLYKNNHQVGYFSWLIGYGYEP